MALEIDQARSQLESLSRIGCQLRQTLPFDELLGLVADEIIEATQANSVSINVRNWAEGNGWFRIRRGSNDTNGLIDEVVQESLSSLESVSRQVVYETGDVASVYCRPLVTENEAIGTITAVNRQTDDLAAIASSYLGGVASFLISVLETYDFTNTGVRAFRRVKDPFYLVEQIAEVVDHLTLDGDDDSLHNGITEAVGQIGGYQIVVLDLVDEEVKDLNLRTAAAQGVSGEDLEKLRERKRRWSVLHRLFRTEFALGETYFIPVENVPPAGDQEMDAETQESIPDVKQQTSTKRWREGDKFFIPLHFSGNRPAGLLTLAQPISGNRPDIHTARMAGITAKYAGLLLEKSQLSREREGHDLKLNAFRDASQNIRSARSETEILGEAAHNLVNIVGALDCTIYSRLPDSQQLVVSAVASELPAKSVIGKGSTFQRDALALVEAVMEPGSPVVRAMGELGTQAPQRYSRVDGAGSYTYVLLPIEVGEVIGSVAELLIPRGYEDFQSAGITSLILVIDQAAIALERVTLAEEGTRRERTIKALSGLNISTKDTTDLAAVMSSICQESLSIIGADGIFLWQRQKEELVGIAASGVLDEGFVGSVLSISSDAFVSAVARRGRGDYVNNYQNQTTFSEHFPPSDSVGSILGVPLKLKEEVTGVLVLLNHAADDSFAPEELEMAALFAGQAAIAIDNAKLTLDLKERVDRLEIESTESVEAIEQERDRVQYLLQLLTELSDTLDEGHAISRALELVIDVVHANQGVILMVDSTSGNLTYPSVYSAYGIRPLSGALTEQGTHQQLAKLAVDQRDAIIVSQSSNELGVVLPQNLGLHSAMAMPLMAGEEVAGVLILFHENSDAFGSEQMVLIEAAGRQVSRVINNTKLFLLIREQTERLGQLLRDETIEAARSQAILESIADGVVVADATGIISLANTAACEMLRLSHDTLVGQLASERLEFHASFGERWTQSKQDWIDGSKSRYQGSFLSHTLKFEDNYVNLHLSPVFADERYIGTVSILRDVTHAVETDRAKTEFVSTVSHELRTPMTSIKGYADLMLMGISGGTTDEQHQYLSVIKSNADRVTGLVNDLLDVARIESGTTTLDLKEIDVSGLIKIATNDHLRALIKSGEKSIETNMELETGLPLVLGDSERLLQVLTNLLDNAYNYTPSGGTITIGAKAIDESVQVSVSDSGIGIRAEDQGKIFDRFYRADDEQARRIAGTGLGLSIVRSLVLLHGGSIEVESKPGEGSSFIIILPSVKKSV